MRNYPMPRLDRLQARLAGRSLVAIEAPNAATRVWVLDDKSRVMVVGFAGHIALHSEIRDVWFENRLLRLGFVDGRTQTASVDTVNPCITVYDAEGNVHYEGGYTYKY